MTWVDFLASASAPEDVLRITKDYLATWDPFELAALPPECKVPAYFVAPEDVVNYAFTLVQAHCGPDAENPVLYPMAKFFSEASRRVAVLMSEAASARAQNGETAGQGR